MKRYKEYNSETGVETIFTTEDLLNSRWALTAQDYQALENGEPLEGGYLGEQIELIKMPDLQMFIIVAPTADGDNWDFHVSAEDPGQALLLYMLYTGNFVVDDPLSEIEQGNMSAEEFEEYIHDGEDMVYLSDIRVFPLHVHSVARVHEWSGEQRDITEKAKAGYETLKERYRARLGAGQPTI